VGQRASGDGEAVNITMLKLTQMARLITLWLVVGAAHAEQNIPEITFGISPQHVSTDLAKLWTPICQYLSHATGFAVKYKTSKDLETFWQQTNEGTFDLVYIVPPAYVKAHAVAGYEAFAKGDEASLVSIILVRKDGPLHLSELQGTKLAVPNLSAFAAAQVPQSYLLSKGVHVTLVAVSNNESVYLTVEKGLYPAGASNLRIFGMQDPAVQAQFRILWKSAPLPPFAFAAHPRVSKSTVERIQKALVKMDADREGHALLAPLNMKRIVSARDGDYDGMRKMKLKRE
jgi:phosphonate transport system substrate-binding protein